MTDIDTQIEDKLDTGLRRLQAHAITLGYYIDHPDQVKYREQAHKAIKTLLDTAVQEARIEEVKRWMPISPDPLNLWDIKFVEAGKRRIKELKSTSKEDK